MPQYCDYVIQVAGRLKARVISCHDETTYTSISSPICVSCGSDIACRRGSSKLSSSSSLVLLLWRRVGGRFMGVGTRFNVRCRRLFDFVTAKEKQHRLNYSLENNLLNVTAHLNRFEFFLKLNLFGEFILCAYETMTTKEWRILSLETIPSNYWKPLELRLQDF